MKLKDLSTPIIGFLAALVALFAWALASPPGSAPDDDFHLPAIWCAKGLVDGKCDPQEPDDGFGLAPAPLSASAICFAFNSDISAACQNYAIDWNSKDFVNSRTNEVGRFPNGFYWTLNNLITDNTLASAMSMRIFNGFLGLVMLFLTFKVAESRVRFALLATWVALLVPLGLFTISSTNPSAWTIIGLGVYWANLITFLTATSKKTLINSGLLTIFSAILALVSRSESNVYIVITSLVITLGVYRGRKFKLLLLPFTFMLIGLISFLNTPSTLGVSTGLAGGLPERSTGYLWFYNTSEITRIWSGSLGGWPLGWFDTPTPSITYFFSMLVFCGLLFLGLGTVEFRRALALFILILALFYIPMRVLVLGKNLVGEGVQPRYFLPLLMVLLGLSLFVPFHKKALKLNFLQYLTIFSGISISHTFALHYTLRRYITGTDVVGFNLNRNVEWWWPGIPNPLTVWAIGSLSFSAATLVGLIHMRKSSLK